MWVGNEFLSAVGVTYLKHFSVFTNISLSLVSQNVHERSIVGEILVVLK